MRFNDHRHHARRVEIEFRPGGNPLADDGVVGMIRLGQDAADMRDGACRFEQHQALIRSGAIESTSPDIVGQGSMIVEGVIPAEREFEAVLAVLRAVTRPGVATHAAEHGLNIANKADLARLVSRIDMHRDFRSQPFIFQDQHAIAIGSRSQQASWTERDQGALFGQMHRSRQIDRFAALQGSQRHQLPIGEAAGQLNALRPDRQRLDLQALGQRFRFGARRRWGTTTSKRRGEKKQAQTRAKVQVDVHIE